MFPNHMISEFGTRFGAAEDRLAKVAPGMGAGQFTVWFIEHDRYRGFVEVDDLIQARAVAAQFVLGHDGLRTHVHRNAATPLEQELAAGGGHTSVTQADVHSRAMQGRRTAILKHLLAA